MPILSGPDWLVNVYLGCFAFGLIFTLVTAFLNFGHFGGHVAHGGHVGHVEVPHGHVEVPHGHVEAPHLHGHLEAPHLHADPGAQGNAAVYVETARRNPEQPAISPFNLPTILAGVTWFGGVGYLLTMNTALFWTMTLGLAVGAGLLGGAIVYTFFAKVLWPAQTPPLDPADFALPGTSARVVSGIVADGTGEILYVKGGTRQVSGARSLDGTPLPKGSEVQVVRYERGLAYVVPLGAPLPALTEGAVTNRLPPRQ